MNHRKYNILWIQTDEMRKDSIGCYGGNNLTPNIDRLAEEGAVFDHHFTTSPVCVPARVSELTGCYPTHTGVLDNSVHYTWGHWPEGKTSFPECFLSHGYTTANYGKYHTPCHNTWGENWHFEHFPEVGEFTYLRPPFLEKDCEVIHLGHNPDAVMISGRFPRELTPVKNVTDHALQWLQVYGHVRRPFLLRVSYLAPHTPVLAPEPFYSMYDGKTYDWNRPTQDLIDHLPQYEKRGIGNYARHTEEEYQRMRRTYYGLVSHIDDQVGRIIDHLKQTGEYDNTIILVTSDHGDLMGEYAQFQKGMFYDTTMNVPCIIKGPGITPGTRFEKLTECVDIGPTLLNLCGFESDPQFDGENMFDSHKEEIISDIMLGGCRRSCIRTQEYCLDITTEKHDQRVSPEEYDGKLIHLTNDPNFRHNLYGDPAYDTVKKHLIDRLITRLYTDRSVPVQHGKKPQ